MQILFSFTKRGKDALEYSFNCTFRILRLLASPDYYQAHIANRIFTKLYDNLLITLVIPLFKEKSFNVVLTFKEV